MKYCNFIINWAICDLEKTQGYCTVVLPSIFWWSIKGAGPHILTVPSSEALAIMDGICGFQLTQFTVRVCPVSSAIGSSLRLCQM